jgi:adenosylhomocysteine nucleosidase
LNHLGIVAAIPAEARSLTRRLIPFGEEVCLREGVFLYLGGVGLTRSRLAAEALLGRGADALLSWGSAGGLVSNLPPGSLVLPKTVIAADQTVYPVDMKWHGYLWNQLRGQLDLHADPMAESPAVLARPAEKKALFRRSGAIAVDMESAAVATVAQKAKVPFMIIRAIADTVDRTVPQSILAAVDDFGRLGSFELLKGLLKRPTELLALVQLARDFRAARASLAAVARLTGGNFLAP